MLRTGLGGGTSRFGHLETGLALSPAAGPEVQQFGHLVAVEHDVGGLQVAVADLVVGEPADCSSHLLEHEHAAGEGRQQTSAQEFLHVLRVVVHYDVVHLLAFLLLLQVVCRNVLTPPVPDELYELDLVLKRIGGSFIFLLVQNFLRQLQLHLHLGLFFFRK